MNKAGHDFVFLTYSFINLKKIEYVNKEKCDENVMKTKEGNWERALGKDRGLSWYFRSKSRTRWADSLPIYR